RRKKSPPQPREGIDDPLVGHLVGTELALDHVRAGGRVDAHSVTGREAGADPRNTSAGVIYRHPRSTTIIHNGVSAAPRWVIEPANRLAARQARQQLGRGQPEPRMLPAGRYVAERR